MKSALTFYWQAATDMLPTKVVIINGLSLQQPDFPELRASIALATQRINGKYKGRKITTGQIKETRKKFEQEY